MKFKDKKMRHAKRKRNLEGVEKAVRERKSLKSAQFTIYINETKQNIEKEMRKVPNIEMILRVLCKPIVFENNKYYQK